MKPTDLTVKILEEIRDAARETNARLDQTNARLDETSEVMLHGFETLSNRVEAVNNRITEVEIRSATMMTGIAGTLHDMKTLLEDRLGLRDRVERCEKDIVVLKGHAGIK